MGAWSLFPSPTTLNLPCATAQTRQVTLTAGQASLVGNPFDRSASLSASSGPTYAITFDAVTNSWSGWTRIDGGSTLTLAPGQGASWQRRPRSAAR
jgi:hypothetical protein